MNLSRFTHATRCGSLLVMSLLAACQPQAALTPGSQSTKFVAQSVSLPTSIEYHEDQGALSSLVYRSTLTYDSQNRLLSISDQLVSSPTAGLPWVQFQYTDNRLTSIDLQSISIDSKAPNYDDEKQPARFELTYAGQDVMARLLIGGKEVQKTMFTLNERGLPVKSSLKGLFFDDKGNLDLIVDSKQHPITGTETGTEVIEQRYDAHPAVLSQIREMQLLDGLLGAANRHILSGLVGVGSSLNTNNLVYTKRRSCSTDFGQYKCGEHDESHIETLALNEQGFPAQLRCSLGALGFYQFTVTYKQVEE